MANKPKNQGTAWETAIVRRARQKGLNSNRLPLQGVGGEPDLEIGYPTVAGDIPAVVWKRLVKAKGKKKRVPDGAPEVVVLSLDDFLHIYELADTSHDAPVPRILVQAKATERLNVTRVLGALQSALQRVL